MVSKLSRRIRSSRCPLFGAACYTYNPAFVEIAALTGYHAIWFEMEHMQISFKEAAVLCRIASGLDMITMIRIPDSRRENVLRAAECGPDILDLPMANTPDVVREFVANGKYAPVGNRGLFGASPAMRYGIGETIAEGQRRINDELCLMAQIETREAAENAEVICSVPGLDAVFLGPGDMSASFGVPGDTENPLVRDALVRTIGAARQQGLLSAMMTPIDEVEFWVEQGVELLFVTSDVLCMKTAAKSFLDTAVGSSRRGQG
jgi:2-keto-3-deoxy-L-rhamnonate aldolase RhmA